MKRKNIGEELIEALEEVIDMLESRDNRIYVETYLDNNRRCIFARSETCIDDTTFIVEYELENGEFIPWRRVEGEAYQKAKDYLASLEAPKEEDIL